MRTTPLLLTLLALAAPLSDACADPLADSLAAEARAAAADYAQYCALCHGAEREGYANDNAPSLRSKTLYALSPAVTYMAIAYGRPGTPMGPYLDEMAGPLEEDRVWRLAAWLSEQAGVAPSAPAGDMMLPIAGDVAKGEAIYARECAECHGAEGEGGEGTALGNPTMLATTPDRFLRLAVAEGREGTKMEGFGGRLADQEIDSVVAFLRSRAQGWDPEAAVRATPPAPADYILNPGGEAPEFVLENGWYVRSKDLYAALEDGRRLVLLDTRVPYFWAMAHIRGSVPIPYYTDFETVVADLPRDGTWIVAYCECPRAAAESAVRKLRGLGFENTAVLWEGYAGWTSLGYPIAVGDVSAQAATPSR